MIHYFINMSLCSGVLILFYIFFLENEKSHFFNRIYLLSSLLASTIIPLITWELDTPLIENIAPVLVADNFIKHLDTTTPIITGHEKSVLDQFGLINYVQTLYWSISALLLLWLIIRYNNLMKQVKKFRHQKFKEASIVLTDADHQPYSFLNYIFVNEVKFRKNLVCEEIIHHELTHIRERHSLDIIVLEIFKAIFWLNPFLFLFRRAVTTNHEFLADQSVIEVYKDIRKYQKIILDAVASDGTPRLGSPLQGSVKFNLTRKRLIKMTKQKSIMKSNFKKLTVIPLSILVIYSFSMKSIGQTIIPEQSEKSIIQRGDNSCPDYLKVYCSVLSKYDLKDVQPKDFQRLIRKEDQEKMIEIFKQLSPYEKEQQIIGFSLMGGPFKKRPPTSKQLESWKNEKEFGVWLNGKRVKNSVLNSYSNTDFAHFSSSRLMRNSAHYGSYTYHLEVMTDAYFRQYNLEHSKPRFHIYYKRKSID